MNNEEQIIQLVEQFLAVAKELLDKGRINQDTYEEITFNKKAFLKRAKDNNYTA